MLGKMTPSTPLSPQFCERESFAPVKFPGDGESNKNIVFKVKINKKETN